MIAVIVATPLQMFNSFMIMRHHFPNDRMDVFALDIACDMHKCISRYARADIIEDVFYIDDVCRRHTKTGIAVDYLFTTEKQKKLLNSISKKRYTDLFSTVVGGAGTWIYTKIKKNNRDVKLHFYEEGLAVYINPLFGYYNGIRSLYKLLGYYCEADFVSDLFLYESRLKVCQDESMSCVSIGKVTRDDLAAINESFELKTSYEGVKALYFENTFKNIMMDGFDESQLIDMVIDCFGKDHVLVRLHPTSDKAKYDGKSWRYDENTDIPWEEIAGMDKNLENCMLVTAVSSAVYTPKLMYDKEPKVMVLGCMVKNEYSMYEWSDIFFKDNVASFNRRFHDTYKTKSRFMLPESFSEMECLLKEDR